MSNPSGGEGVPRGISLSNTVHSEVAPCLPLPSLPVFCGALHQELNLFDDTGGSRWNSSSSDVSGKIADLLRNTDVSYFITSVSCNNMKEKVIKSMISISCQSFNLSTGSDIALRFDKGDNFKTRSHTRNLKDEEILEPGGSVGNFNLFNDVLRHDPEAFEYASPGPAKQSMYRGNLTESKPLEQRMPTINQVPSDSSGMKNNQHDHNINNDIMGSSRKPKVKKKGKDDLTSATFPDNSESQGTAIAGFCEILDDICARAEIICDDRDEAEWVPLSHADLKALVNEIMSIRSKKVLHMVPVDILSRTLKVLDRQIHRAEGLSIDDCENLLLLHKDQLLLELDCQTDSELLIHVGPVYGFNLELKCVTYEEADTTFVWKK
ncbi:UNVERIFIED_CONTAM: Sister chromatid cohesion protein SCC2 [Sesamum latifolium]|uniref:Sister chromatid cohesion protein SCC2 n=1 Tax=Sesamum latifolium TaxID=2727402 RepID=A0AAW2X8I7_9LAMI